MLCFAFTDAVPVPAQSWTQPNALIREYDIAVVDLSFWLVPRLFTLFRLAPRISPHCFGIGLPDRRLVDLCGNADRW